MNNLAIEYLSPHLALCKTHISSKKKALETICNLIHQEHPDVQIQPILESLLTREKLGSTAIGEGIAVPHGKLCRCLKPMIVIMTLDEGIDFDSCDRKPVDIIVAFIVPEDADDEHLKFLSDIAKLLKSQDNRAQIRQLESSSALYQFFLQKLQ